MFVLSFIYAIQIGQGDAMEWTQSYWGTYSDGGNLVEDRQQCTVQEREVLAVGSGFFFFFLVKICFRLIYLKGRDMERGKERERDLTSSGSLSK